MPCYYLPEVRRLRIHMLTPLRIRRNGELLDKLDFPTIIRNITRRMEMITGRYGGWSDKTEAGRIRTLSQDVSTVKERLESVSMERYSNRLGKKMDFDGLMGDIWLKAKLRPLFPGCLPRRFYTLAAIQPLVWDGFKWSLFDFTGLRRKA